MKEYISQSERSQSFREVERIQRENMQDAKERGFITTKGWLVIGCVTIAAVAVWAAPFIEKAAIFGGR